jgi:hypothetical protein
MGVIKEASTGVIPPDELPKVYFARIWAPEMWQGGFLHSAGGGAVLALFLTGFLVGVGVSFLPRPGRGSAG